MSKFPTDVSVGTVASTGLPAQSLARAHRRSCGAASPIISDCVFLWQELQIHIYFKKNAEFPCTFITSHQWQLHCQTIIQYHWDCGVNVRIQGSSVSGSSCSGGDTHTFPLKLGCLSSCFCVLEHMGLPLKCLNMVNSIG